MHILMTVNAAWNIWNFRRPLVEALTGDGHRITVLAPTDDAVPELERLGCRVRPLEMSVKGPNAHFKCSPESLASLRQIREQ